MVVMVLYKRFSLALVKELCPTPLAAVSVRIKVGLRIDSLVKHADFLVIDACQQFGSTGVTYTRLGVVTSNAFPKKMLYLGDLQSTIRSGVQILRESAIPLAAKTCLFHCDGTHTSSMLWIADSHPVGLNGAQSHCHYDSRFIPETIADNLNNYFAYA